MLAPSSVRSRFSSSTLRLYGRSAAPSTASRRNTSYERVADLERAACAEAVLLAMRCSSCSSRRRVDASGGGDVSGGPDGAADGVLDEVEDAVEVVGGHAGGEAADQAVEDQAQEVGEQRDGDVVAHDAGGALALEPLGGGLADGLLALGPAGGEGGVGAQPAAHLELHAEPAGVLVAQVAHDLHQAGLGDDLGGAGGVVLGEGEEQRLLVAEVVEDRAPRQPGLGLEHPDGGALVAVPGEGPPGRGEDRAAPGGELLLRTPWACRQPTSKPYVRLARLRLASRRGRGRGDVRCPSEARAWLAQLRGSATLALGGRAVAVRLAAGDARLRPTDGGARPCEPLVAASSGARRRRARVRGGRARG